jgi:hypothetical protein
MAATLDRRVLALGVLVVVAATAAGAEEQVANPHYTFWSKSKPGATVVLKETTKLSGAAAAAAPEATDVKTVTYKLVEVNDKAAVVEARVTQQEEFGFVESAPTRHIFPAKMSKAALQDMIAETGAKGEDAMLKVGDKELKTKLISGTLKKKGGEEVEFKVWLSDEVPGSIVKRVRTAKVNGEVAAVTTVELESFKKGD